MKIKTAFIALIIMLTFAACSGNREGRKDTLTGKFFDSEDAIFEYYNAKITNRGCDAKQAFNWFFTGEFAPDWESSHPAMLKDDPDHAITEAYFLNNSEAECEFEIR